MAHSVSFIIQKMAGEGISRSFLSTGRALQGLTGVVQSRLTAAAGIQEWHDDRHAVLQINKGCCKHHAYNCMKLVTCLSLLPLLQTFRVLHGPK